MIHQVISGYGQFHTDEEGKADRRPYVTVDLECIRELVDDPQQVDKAKAQWIIPSSLPSRTFKLQEEQGQFSLLWADIDKDPPELDDLQNKLYVDILSGADHEIYTSRSASADYQKSRILIPLDKPLSGADWLLCQQTLNDKLQSAEIVPDRKSEGCAQLCYLPNRGQFYDSRSSRDGIYFNPLEAWAAEIAEKRALKAKAAANAAKRKAETKSKREARSHLNEDSPINAFNAAYPVGDILIQAGYDQDGNHDRYRHPQSESGNYSASVRDGRVHTLSSNDRLYTGGSGGGAHDAFSAFTVLFHHGDINKAVRDAGDNWLTIDGESWNKVKQMEYIQKMAQADVSGFLSSLSEDAKPNPLTTLVSLEPINQEELRKARLTPRCVLTDFLYADVRTRISAGGTGKTTVALFEAVTLALGRDLWGRTPNHPCRTVIVTREDSREILVARMREIIDAMHLEESQVSQVLANVLVVDVSGVSFRLSAVSDDVVVPHAHNLNWLVDSLKEWKPDWIIFDPLVSFGVGESRVNDAEQGLIEAFRVLRNHLDCCIEGIHHSGKANARDKNTDQYAGRGGSALSDGCRMVVVMQPLEPDEWLSATGFHLGDGESGIVMALPKLSFAGKQEPIYIRRRNYHFSRITPIRRSPEQESAGIENQVCQFITYEYSQGHHYSGKDLEDSARKMNLTRSQIRSAITALKVSGRIIYVQVKGKSGSHYEPVSLAEACGDTQEKEVCDVDY